MGMERQDTGAGGRGRLDRREFMGVTGAAIMASRLSAGAPAERPNILIVHTDDQAQWAMGAYGNPDIHTPHMDSLARDGALFTRAFVSTPVCSPARANLMTGLDSLQHGIRDWIRPTETIGLDPRFVTFPELLRAAGYATGYIGKWHLGTRPEFHPLRRMDHFLGFLEGGNRPKDPVLEIDGETAQREGWLVDMLTDAAIDYMANRTREPFFCMVSYRNPHNPHTPVQPEDEEPYRGKSLTLFKGSEVAPEKTERILREYYACCTAVDRNLGRLLATLDTMGVADNTLVLFTGDNGYMIGHHGLNTKGNAHTLTEPRACRPNMFDPSMLVPLVIRWPAAIAPGLRIDEMVGHIDFFETFCDIAGVAPEERPETESRSFLPLLQGRRIPWRDTFYGSYDQYQYEPAANLRMARTDDWKLVRNFAPGGADELYHLAEDPDELDNRADAPEAREVRADLEERLRAWRERLNDHLLRA